MCEQAAHFVSGASLSNSLGSMLCKSTLFFDFLCLLVGSSPSAMRLRFFLAACLASWSCPMGLS